MITAQTEEGVCSNPMKVSFFVYFRSVFKCPPYDSDLELTEINDISESIVKVLQNHYETSMCTIEL